MKKICSKGYKISATDEKVLDHFAIESIQSWSASALSSMIYKSIEFIMKRGFEQYKKTQTGNISIDYAVIIPAILAFPDFKMKKIQVPEAKIIKKTENPSKEIWENGFDIEDYEEMALNALYEDPEGMLYWYLEEKIYQRRKGFIKEKEDNFIKAKKSFPANEDAFIDFVTKDLKYKNRKTAEREFYSQVY